MVQLNQYKKTCYLTDAEKAKFNDFLKSMFDIDNIQTAYLYLDGETSNAICEIVGLEKESLSKVGSLVMHDNDI